MNWLCHPSSSEGLLEVLFQSIFLNNLKPSQTLMLILHFLIDQKVNVWRVQDVIDLEFSIHFISVDSQSDLTEVMIWQMNLCSTSCLRYFWYRWGELLSLLALMRSLPSKHIHVAMHMYTSMQIQLAGTSLIIFP